MNKIEVINATLQMAQDSISNILGKRVVVTYQDAKPTFIAIETIVCREMKVSIESLRLRKGTRQVKDAKHLIIWMVFGQHHPDVSKTKTLVNLHWNLKHNTTNVKYAIKKVQDLNATDKAFTKESTRIFNLIFS